MFDNANKLKTSYVSAIFIVLLAASLTCITAQTNNSPAGDAIGQLMAESNPFAGVPDRQKQTMYETMIIYTMLAQAGTEEARQTGDAASAEIYRKLAGQTLQAVSGTPPEKFRFDANGESTAEDNPAPKGEESLPPSPSTNTAMHASDLVMEFQDNEARANLSYAGKRVRIIGKVSAIQIGREGMTVLTFMSSLSTYSNARCYFSKSQGSRVTALSAGHEVTVEGTVRGLGEDSEVAFVVLENCVVQ